MASADEHFINEIFLTLFHTGYTSAATSLSLIFSNRHTLDIAVIGKSNNAVFLRD